MKTFDYIDGAEKEMRKRKAPVESVILTQNAAVEFLKKHLGTDGNGLDKLPVELMHEIQDDDGAPNADGSLNFTNVQEGDVDTVHAAYPTDAEIREFVDGWECWQLWKR